MRKRLEDFINNNREEFDKFEPGPVVWHNIQQELKKPAGQKGILISVKMLRWSAAAAVVLMLGAGAYFFVQNKKNPVEVAANAGNPKSNNLPVVPLHDTVKESAGDTQQTLPAKKEDPQLARTEENNNDSYNEELYHYTKLVELKQNEIKKIKKDEPLLYQQFAGDFNKLDSTFHILKKQLPVNPNREQILEAMIQNLQYQEALLNQQLNIIKKINNTKKQAYEKAYRSA
jgi:hypothetical protein